MKHFGALREDAGVRDRLSRIQARHQQLEGRLRELGRRPFLTPREEREMIELKKYKLQAKDEIASLRGLG